tara:strand:+ start:61 stop:492 length:432 start_codon:yes stop_codon:yes gene_type:complete
MNINELLKLKLKDDLLKELSEFNFDPDILNEKIDEKISENDIIIDEPKQVTNESESHCCARIMGERYSDRRCPWNAQPDSDYCKNHLKRLAKSDYLAFGRYDEERPIINEQCNKIPWRNTTAMEDINTVIQYQNMKLLKLIKL